MDAVNISSKALIITFLLAFSLGGTTICSAQSSTVKVSIRRGYRHIMDGEYRLASQELRKGLKVAPDHGELNALYGKSLFLQHEQEAAYEPLLKAIQQGENSAEYYWYLAQALHIRLSLDSADTFYNKSLDKLPSQHHLRPLIERQREQVVNAREQIKNPVDIKLENLGVGINSRFPEYTPLITADESRLYFTSRRFSNWGQGKEDDLPYEDVYYCLRNADGSWSSPANVGPPVNTEFHDATVALTADGQKLWIYRSEGFYEVQIKGRKLKEPQYVGSPIESKEHEPSASLSPDQRTLYFAREIYDEGHYDLFYSQKQRNGKWSEPQKLPSTINTPYNENSPFIHPDGKTLYFSSSGHNSMGGYDLFKSTRQADGSWSTPENLGWPLNSAGDDIYLVVSASGRFAYFSSSRAGGVGNLDLYRIDFRPDGQKGKPPETPQVLLVTGQILNRDTDMPTEAELYIIDLQKNDTLTVAFADPETGQFLIALPQGSHFALFVEKKGFLTETRSFDTQNLSGYEEAKYTVSLKKAKYEVGERLLLRNIFFDFNRSTLRPESEAELDRLYQILKSEKQMRIRIRGHTDNVGSDDYNLQLSSERAEAVVKYLIVRGIQAERLESEGLGEVEPVDNNESDSGRQNNRRTEFEVLKL